VWTVLYALMAASAYRVWRREAGPARSRALALWWTQLAFNAAWSPLFFGAHRPRAALADLGLLFASLSAYALQSSRVDRGAAGLIAPYLAWAGFAGVLNEEIVRRNGKRSGLVAVPLLRVGRALRANAGTG
jgi:tryptophan-rich sensory protein